MLHFDWMQIDINVQIFLHNFLNCGSIPMFCEPFLVIGNAILKII